MALDYRSESVRKPTIDVQRVVGPRFQPDFISKGDTKAQGAAALRTNWCWRPCRVAQRQRAAAWEGFARAWVAAHR